MMPVISKLHEVFGNICYFCYLGERVALVWSKRSSPNTAKLWAKLFLGQAESSRLLRKQKAVARNRGCQ